MKPVRQELPSEHPSQVQPRDLFRLLVESVQEYAIFLLDPQGHVTSWNPGAERIKGYRADEILGRHFSVFYPPESVQRGEPQRALARAAAAGSYQFEGRRLRKDGTVFWADVVITALHEDGELVGFAKVTRDASERRRAEEQRQGLARAEDAVRARDEFIAVASHELKTPLTPLRLLLDALLRPGYLASAPPSAVEAKLRAIDEQADRLSRLTDGLIDIARAPSSEEPLRCELVDLGALAEEVAGAHRGRSLPARAGLHVEASAGVCGWWDRARVAQAIDCLLENALKYGAGKPVHVAVQGDGALARLTVRDEGIGIAPEHQARIFERFERAAPVAHYGGFGLGLWLVRRAALAHGGAVRVQSRLGQGSVFALELPRELRPPQP